MTVRTTDELLPFGGDINAGNLPPPSAFPGPQMPEEVHYQEIGLFHVHDFRRLARTLAPPTDVYDCGCGERRTYIRDTFGPGSLLPEPPGSSVHRALSWTWIERRGNHTLAMSEGRPY